MKNILLLHGWGYSSYSNIAKHSTPWHNKQEFINKLRKHYVVHTPIFPGFCSEPEPQMAYDLDDFAMHVETYIRTNNLNIECILGNSFGGQVATRYKTLIDPSMPIILIVPAILRKSSNSKKFITTPSILDPIRNFLRDLYVIYVKKTPEMKFGTKFIRESYQKIVRYNLINEVARFNNGDVIILLGSNDNMIDTETIYTKLSKTIKKIYKINGGHEIIETHSDELVDYIIRFTSTQ